MAIKRSFEEFLGRLLGAARDGELAPALTRTTVPPREAAAPATNGGASLAPMAMPRPVTSASLREWITSEVRRSVPRWTIHRRLSKAATQNPSAAEKTVLAIEIKAIEDLLVERNRRGKELERGGQVEQAIALYEANVADRFNGSHAYERLRVLYKERGDFTNTIRVCNSYLRHVGTDERLVQAYQAEIQNISPARGREFQETRPA